jgi:tetratricopeptide (TPR) repeat protein
MRCSRCGHENSGGLRLCAECGSKLTQACGTCGAENDSGKQVCGECGASLAASDALNLRAQTIAQLLQNAARAGMVPEEWEALTADGRAVAALLDDRRVLLEIELGLCRAHCLCGYLSDSREPLRRAVELADALGGLTERVLATDMRADISWLAGRLRGALRPLEELEDLAARDPSIGVQQYGVSIANWAVGRQAWVLAWLGRPDEAVPRRARAEQVARERGEIDAQSWLCNSACEAAWLAGRAEDAVRDGRRALEFAERSGTPMSRVLALWVLGQGLLQAGRAAEARDLLELVVAQSRERRLGRMFFAGFLAALAEVDLETGDVDRALALAEEAVAYGRRADTLAHTLRGEVVVARARIARGDFAEAAACLSRCDTLLEETGAMALAPCVTEQCARLAAARGEDARALLCEAQQEFAAVGATGHVVRLAREIGS